MDIKTIAVHLDHSAACERRVEVAARLARAHHGHLIGVVPTGLPAGGAPPAPGDGEPSVRGGHDDLLALRAQAVAHLFGDFVRRYPPPSFEHRTVDGPPIEALVKVAGTCDLMVLGQADPDPQSGERPLAAAARDLADQLLMRAARPVLIVPSAGPLHTIGERILVAWNASRESALAARDALPFLRKAGQVSLVTLSRSERFEEAQVSAREMVDWLGRHGVHAEAEQYLAIGNIARGLQSCAAGMDADLIVMGGYAQGPLREVLLGGVTHDMLARSRIPLLLSH
ncbi:universal stress protein [Variovorax sp. JS1663]|uniref:universal stress protein n=1 Tax=Variovorax sp. JS1663 TaxID=1851577 RepID=UPI000B6865FD|nr:universal stress protein [Variovorax sp. JS1663]OUM00912.1 hypothetical protein A8M77_18570 [Variovorax sp. JS1663]